MLIADELVPGKPWGVTRIELGCKVKHVLYADGGGDDAKKQACGVATINLATGEEVHYHAKKVVLAAG
eukprot:6078392-Ditylum_brightwellii.AAC.1